MMAGGDSRQGRLVDVLGRDDRYATARDRAQRRGPFTSFEEGAFAKDSSRPDFSDVPTIDDHRQHTIEEKEEFLPLLALLDQGFPRLKDSDLRLHDGTIVRARPGPPALSARAAHV